MSCVVADTGISLADQRQCREARRAGTFILAALTLAALLLCTGGCVTPQQPLREVQSVQVPLNPCATTGQGDAAVCQRFSGPIRNLDFEPGEHALDLAARESLELLIRDMKQYPSVVLAIGGHTDNRGSARTNLELSKKRVMSVVRYLVVNDIDGRRLRPHGYGESRPVVSNATAEGRQRNRRIELNMVEPDADGS